MSSRVDICLIGLSFYIKISRFLLIIILSATLQTDGNSALVQTATDVKLTSFDWHPTHNNRLIVVGDTGALADVYLAERTAIVSFIFVTP